MECAAECAYSNFSPEECTVYKCATCGEVFTSEMMAKHHVQNKKCLPRDDMHRDFLCESCVNLTAEGYYCVDCKNRHPHLPIPITDSCPDFDRALR